MNKLKESVELARTHAVSWAPGWPGPRHIRQHAAGLGGRQPQRRRHDRITLHAQHVAEVRASARAANERAIRDAKNGPTAGEAFLPRRRFTCPRNSTHTAGLTMQRPCLTCGVPTGGTYCPRHRRTTKERGYGLQHQRARARLAETLPTLCGYGCGRTLHPGSPWVAAHVIDGDPTAGWIVSCRSCNERAKQGTPHGGG